MNIALCFQPLALTYNFKKGVARNEQGEELYDKQGKPIMERDLIAAYKEQLKPFTKPSLIYRSPR